MAQVTSAPVIQYLPNRRAAGLASLDRGLQQLNQGLASIALQKERRTEESVLSRLSKATTRDEVQSMLLELEQSRADKPENILSALGEMINPGAPYRGMTGAERQIRGGILSDILAPQRPGPYEGFSPTEVAKARRVKAGLVPRAGTDDTLKKLTKRRNLLVDQRNDKTDEDGNPYPGQEGRVKVLEKEQDKVDEQIYRLTTEDETAYPDKKDILKKRAIAEEKAKLLAGYKFGDTFWHSPFYDKPILQVKRGKRWRKATDLDVKTGLKAALPYFCEEDRSELQQILDSNNIDVIRKTFQQILKGG